MLTIFYDETHTTSVLQQLWLHCESEEFCDVVLIAGPEEMRIPAHRNILVVVSEYFKGMFMSSMRESVAKEVKLSNLDGEILKSLIEYCYTGRLVITDDVVVELLKTADMLLLTNAVEACGKFLTEQLHPSNCLGFADFAERYHCQMLLQKAKDYCSDHFMEVNTTDEFFELNAERLGELLDRDNLCVSAEDDVFKSLMTWVQYEPNERDADKNELLKSVRMPLLERSFLMEHVGPVCTSNESRRHYIEALDWHSWRNKKVLNAGKSTRLRRSTQLLFALTENKSLTEMYIHYYCPQRLKWLGCTKSVENRSDFGVCTIKDNLYFIGGSNARNIALDTIVGLNLTTMTMLQVNPMTHRRKGCCAVAVQGILYVLGGWNGSNSISSVEQWNQETNTWNEVAPMSVSRSHFGIAYLGDKLYVVGGVSDGTKLNSVEYYDAQQDVWTTVAAMHKSRSCPAVAVANGLIYAVGSRGGSTVECYNPATDKWTMLCSLRGNFLDIQLCTTFGDKVLACYKDCFEEYNDANNNWEEKSSLNGLASIKYIFPYSDKILVSEFPEY